MASHHAHIHLLSIFHGENSGFGHMSGMQKPLSVQGEHQGTREVAQFID